MSTETNELLASTFDAVPDAIIVVTPDGIIRAWSRSAERIFGWMSDEIVGQDYRILVPDYDRARFEGLYQRVLAGESIRSEAARLRKDGVLVFCRSSVSPMRRDDTITGMVVTLHDVTEQRRLEEELRHAQKMEAVGQLAAGIAHDFNNQLTTILGYAELADQALPDGHPVKPDLTEIVNAAQSSAALTRQLLTFSRKQVINLQPLDVSELLDGLQKMLRRAVREDISIIVRTTEPALVINADRAQMEHILLNLVVNARDAMPGGGRILIETTAVRLDETYIGVHLEVNPGDYVVVSVTDTGEGIPPGIQARIFDPFFTTKAPGQGTGLGLAMVYGSVKQMNGSIWVYSEQGRGTTFKMYFPRLSAAAAADLQRTPRRSTPGTGTILVVDDDPRVRGLTARTLEHAGYTVHAAAHGAEALAIARQLKVPVDLLVTDVVMPEVNGPTLAQALVDMGLKRVLYLSGYADQPIIEKQIARGAVSFLAKPFSPAELADRVARLLKG
jgi:PAS domain S-box-containing protein